MREKKMADYLREAAENAPKAAQRRAELEADKLVRELTDACVLAAKTAAHEGRFTGYHHFRLPMTWGSLVSEVSMVARVVKELENLGFKVKQHKDFEYRTNNPQIYVEMSW